MLMQYGTTPLTYVSDPQPSSSLFRYLYPVSNAQHYGRRDPCELRVEKCSSRAATIRRIDYSPS